MKWCTLGHTSCHTKGAVHTHTQDDAQATNGGYIRVKDPPPGMGSKLQPKGPPPGNEGVGLLLHGHHKHKRGPYTELSNPPSPSRGTCHGVPARPQPQNNAMFSCPDTSRSLGPPFLHNLGRRSHTQHYARARYGGDRRMKDPHPGMARDKQQKGVPPWIERFEQQRLDHMRCTPSQPQHGYV